MVIHDGIPEVSRLRDIVMTMTGQVVPWAMINFALARAIVRTVGTVQNEWLAGLSASDSSVSRAVVPVGRAAFFSKAL